MIRHIPASIAIGAAALAAFVFAALGVWPPFFDMVLAQEFSDWRKTHPDAVLWLVRLTDFGGSPFLLTLTAIVALLVAWRRKWTDAVLLAGIVLGGRTLIELIKLGFGRARPDFDAHPVFVFSQSFPSGHAGNSMITYLAIALVALPERWRGRGAAAAVLFSLAIGATRPLLGVHWPTDVLAGWLFGLAWVWLCLELAGRFRTS